MKRLYSIPGMLAATLMLGLFAMNAASEDGKRESKQPSSVMDEEQNQSSSDEATTEPLQISLLVRDSPYQRGAEKCRVSTETGASGPSLAILASQTTQTTREAPPLYWYLSQATTCRVEITLIETQTGQTLADITLMPPLLPGVHSVRLVKRGQHLALGSRYAWSVSLVPDIDDRAKDIVVSVDLEYVKLPDTLRARLAGVTSLAMSSIYAEAGFYYDALVTVLELTKEAPNTLELRKQRIALLEKVGLQETLSDETAQD